MFFIILSFFLSGCTEGKDVGKEANYETTKKIVIDILQTEDGKKAIQDAIHDEEMKKELVIQSEIVKDSLNEMLNSEKATEMWTHLFEDPSFVEGFVKSTGDSQKELMKQLMYDAEFQKQMLELLHNPEMTKQLLTVVKSQQFREHLEETIQETISSPLFLSKIEKTLLKAADKEKKKKEEKGSEDEANERREEQSGGKEGDGEGL